MTQARLDAARSSDEMGDKGTADLFTEISRSVDKDLWFGESHAIVQNEN
jgi:starvation-inducible DNA-binding protein